MGVGRNESGVQTRPNQRYNRAHYNSFKMHLASGKRTTHAEQVTGREELRSSHFALYKKKAGRCAAHAKKADAATIRNISILYMEGRVHARWTPEPAS